jgi:hypothetical protein
LDDIEIAAKARPAPKVPSRNRGCGLDTSEAAIDARGASAPRHRRIGVREIIRLAVSTMLCVTPAVAKPAQRNSDPHTSAGLSLHLASQVLDADSDVTVLVTVEPDARNTSLVVEADGAPFYTSSEIALEGADAKRLHTLTFKRLEGGLYDITARLYSGGHLRATTRRPLLVGSVGVLESGD